MNEHIGEDVLSPLIFPSGSAASPQRRLSRTRVSWPTVPPTYLANEAEKSPTVFISFYAR